MAILDIAKLVGPVSGEAPSGPNLDSDPAYLALETAATTKQERLVGGTGDAAEGPDFNVVSSQALELLGRTKDLRVVAHLTLALLHRHGALGFAEGLTLVRDLLESQWASLHPELDPEDDGSLPPARTMALAALTVPPVLVALRRAPLLLSRALGPLSLNDLAPTDGAPDAARSHAVFQECPLPDLEACAAGLQKALDDLAGIERAFETHTPDRGPDLTGLVRYFHQVSQAVQPRLDERHAAEQPAAGTPAGEGEGTARPRGLSGDILSREDVVRALDKITAYFERHEPSSPIPLLVERCKRLVTMSFLDIINDIAPEGLKQANQVVGKRDGK